MKNALNYYYGLDVLNIHQKENTFFFKHKNKEYLFTRCDIQNINEVYETSTTLNNYGVLSHKIVLNNDKQIITKINDINYILMEVYTERKKINLNDIIIFNNINNFGMKKIDDWYNLWTNKIDYLEYQISQMGKKHHHIRKNFSYYVGMAENAICLVKNINSQNLYYSFNHRRINFNDTLQDLYNPINFIVDLRIRDVCEYLKSCFFNKIDIENELFLYLENNNLNYDESCCFLARMLFPTYYFDIYEKIINNEIDENQINNIIILANDYEKLIKKLYFYLKNKVNIPTIEWLTN